MKRPSSKPLSGPEWSELAQLLASCGTADAIDVDGLHGLLTVSVIGPAPLMPSRWIPLAFGGDPIFERQSQAERFMGLAMQLHNQIAGALERDRYQLARNDRRGTRVSLDACAWTRGFCLGVELDEATWDDEADVDEELSDAVDLLLAFGADTIPGGYDTAAQVAAAVPSTVRWIQDHWRRVGGFPVPQDSRAVKIGRNDPCPCGSGKKYKRCCLN